MVSILVCRYERQPGLRNWFLCLRPRELCSDLIFPSQLPEGWGEGKERPVVEDDP